MKIYFAILGVALLVLIIPTQFIIIKKLRKKVLNSFYPLVFLNTIRSLFFFTLNIVGWIFGTKISGFYPAFLMLLSLVIFAVITYYETRIKMLEINQK